MSQTSHIIEPEELMAYLDGELPPDRETAAAAHLQRCEECQRLAADFQGISRRLRTWEVETHDLPRPAAVVAVPKRGFGFKWRWPALACCAAGLVVVVAVNIPRRRVPLPGQVFNTESGFTPAPAPAPLGRTEAGLKDWGTRLKAQFGGDPLSVVPKVDTRRDELAHPPGPMIVRTAQLTLSTRDFDQTRAGINAVLARHRGYLAELNVRTPVDSGRVLDATVRVPSDQLDATMSELKKLGRVEAEQQTGEEVTQQFVDLEARLANAKNTERRLTDLLAQRTGKLSDVLEVEREIDRVRGEIERMEAERKNLSNRIEFATLKATVTEGYKAQLQMAPDSVVTRLRNAAVDGLRSMAGSVVDVALFLLAYVPSILLWLALLFFPARFVLRRWRRD